MYNWYGCNYKKHPLSTIFNLVRHLTSQLAIKIPQLCHLIYDVTTCGHNSVDVDFSASMHKISKMRTVECVLKYAINEMLNSRKRLKF